MVFSDTIISTGYQVLHANGKAERSPKVYFGQIADLKLWTSIAVIFAYNP